MRRGASSTHTLSLLGLMGLGLTYEVGVHYYEGPAIAELLVQAAELLLDQKRAARRGADTIWQAGARANAPDLTLLERVVHSVQARA